MNTKCLDTLNWFIEISKKDKWQLIYDKNLSTNVFGIIDYDEDTHGYKFYLFYMVILRFLVL